MDTNLGNRASSPRPYNPATAAIGVPRAWCRIHIVVVVVVVHLRQRIACHAVLSPMRLPAQFPSRSLTASFTLTVPFPLSLTAVRTSGTRTGTLCHSASCRIYRWTQPHRDNVILLCPVCLRTRLLTAVHLYALISLSGIVIDVWRWWYLRNNRRGYFEKCATTQVVKAGNRWSVTCKSVQTLIPASIFETRYNSIWWNFSFGFNYFAFSRPFMDSLNLNVFYVYFLNVI